MKKPEVVSKRDLPIFDWVVEGKEATEFSIQEV
jgi:hypothetical protein